MKPSNFRIGNYVTGIYEDEDGIKSSTLCRITAIDEHGNLGDGFEFMFESIEGEMHEVYDDSNPIPLTEEWLLRFGFFQSYHKSYSLGKEQIFNVWSKGTFTYNQIQAAWWYNGLLEIQPEYVHQLQNLYFALTGTELIDKETI
jgi:hypothetical protein